MLTVLCFSIRPLTISELIDAYAVELDAFPYPDREGRSYKQDGIVDIIYPGRRLSYRIRLLVTICRTRGFGWQC